MAKKNLTVGLIGYQFMGKAHSSAYRQVNRFFDLPLQVRMKTICGRTESKVSEAAETLGWEGYALNYHDVLADPEIDVIDIATPGNMHCEIAIAAAEAGKIVWCEKPIGNTLDEAERMHAAIQKAGVLNGVYHNYRKAPAVALAKQMIDDGTLGEIHHMRAVYLQDWITDPNFPLVWRLQKSVAGSGTHGDLTSHLIDLGRYLVGDFEEVSGLLHTFVNERPLLDDSQGGLGEAGSAVGGTKGKVDVDDASMFIGRFKCGALASFEATRFAQGRKNHGKFEINGSKGSVVFCLERLNELEYYDASDPSSCQGVKLIQATDASHPYAGNYWPVGHIIGYEHTFVNWVADAVQAVHDGGPISPNFEDGLKNQIVLDAVERSAATRSWVSI
jgi:predicted dehydrogenase